MKTVEEEFSYQEGQSVTILYDEKSPRHPSVKGDKEPKMVWQNYLVFAIVSFVIVAIVFVVTMPSTLDFTKDQRNLHGMMLHMVLF